MVAKELKRIADALEILVNLLTIRVVEVEDEGVPETEKGESTLPNIYTKRLEKVLDKELEK